LKHTKNRLWTNQRRQNRGSTLLAGAKRPPLKAL